MSQHSPIGASSAERWFNCPGSIELAKLITDKSEPSFYAAQGTGAHQLGEKYLQDGKEMDGFWLDEVIPIEDDETGIITEITVDEDMIDAVDKYISAVYDELRVHQVPQHKLCVEVEFKLKHIDAEAFGTCDAMFVVPYDRVVVIDYKHGAGVLVEAQNNKQLLYYALGAYYSLLEIDREELQYVETLIIQPRANHMDGWIRRAVYTITELLLFEKELKNAIARVRCDEGKRTFSAGKWCRFCKAKPICPAIRNEVGQTLETTIGTQKFTLKPVESLMPSHIALILTHAELIKDWVSSIQAYAHKIAESGVDIPGYKLVSRRSNRQWVDEQKVIDMFEFDYGDEIFNKKLRSPAQMEKLLGKKHAKIIDDFTEKPETGKVLAIETDSRPPEEADIIRAFANV